MSSNYITMFKLCMRFYDYHKVNGRIVVKTSFTDKTYYSCVPFGNSECDFKDGVRVVERLSVEQNKHYSYVLDHIGLQNKFECGGSKYYFAEIGSYIKNGAIGIYTSKTGCRYTFKGYCDLLLMPIQSVGCSDLGVKLLKHLQKVVKE